MHTKGNGLVRRAPVSGTVLVAEGLHDAALVDVLTFTNAFGERAGLVFKVATGPYEGTELIESAALTGSPRGKLVDLVRGMGGAEGSLVAARELIGRKCQIAVRHETTKTGKTYAAVAQTFR